MCLVIFLVWMMFLHFSESLKRSIKTSVKSLIIQSSQISNPYTVFTQRCEDKFNERSHFLVIYSVYQNVQYFDIFILILTLLIV